MPGLNVTKDLVPARPVKVAKSTAESLHGVFKDILRYVLFSLLNQI